MTRPRTDNLIADLKRWCDADYGRASELARILNVNRQVVSDWFARKSSPNSEVTLAIIEFLEDPEAHRKPGRGLAK